MCCMLCVVCCEPYETKVADVYLGMNTYCKHLGLLALEDNLVT